MKNKDAERIKDLEKELDQLRDIRRLNENLEKKSSKNEKRYNDEKKKREIEKICAESDELKEL